MANKTMLQWNAERLRAILMNSNLDYKIDGYYDLTQPDSMDESDSGGVWDLARDVTDETLSDLYESDVVGDLPYQNTYDNMQSLLYNLFCVFKTEQPDD